MSGLAAVAAVAAVVGPRPADPARAAIDQLSSRLCALTPDDPDRYRVSTLGRRAPVRAVRAQLTAGWWPVGDPVALIAAMRSGHGRHLSISPAVAGATMIVSLAHAAAGRLAVALAVAGQAYDTGPDSLAVKLDAEGLVRRIAVRRPTLVVLPGDPLATTMTSASAEIATSLGSVASGSVASGSVASGSGASAAIISGSVTSAGAVQVVPDRTALVGWAARRIWATLDPLIDELHRTTRYGRVPIWNLVADAVLGPATVAPRLAGLDQQAGRAVGVALVEALVGLGAPIHRYGTVREVVLPEAAVSGVAGVPPVLKPVRGSCCLHYRLTQEKCETCPLAARRP